MKPLFDFVALIFVKPALISTRWIERQTRRSLALAHRIWTDFGKFATFVKAVTILWMAVNLLGIYVTISGSGHDRDFNYFSSQEVQAIYRGESVRSAATPKPGLWHRIQDFITASKPHPGSGDDLTSAIDKRLAYYNRCRADLIFNRYLVAVTGGLAVFLIVSGKEALKIPWMFEDVPRAILLRIFPLIALYLWLDFGFTLNACIDSRQVVMRLMNAQLKDRQFDAAVDPDRFIHAHYTISRCAEVEDRGLLDSWFWMNLNTSENFINIDRGTYNTIVPRLCLLFHAALYGLLHTTMLFLPCVDSRLRDRTRTTYAKVIAIICGGTVLASHISFFYAGYHNNWFQIATLLFGWVFLVALARYRLRHPRKMMERAPVEP